MKRFSTFVLLLLLLSGCGKEQPSEDVTAKADVYVETDTTLDLCMYNTDTFNPLVTSVKHNAEVLSCLYDSLFTATDQFQAMPDLCTQYSVSEDRCVFSAKLKKGVRFQDGAYLTLQDAADSVNRIVTSNGYYKKRLQTVLGAVVEGNVLKITFSEPMENIPILLDFPILPAGGFIEEGSILAPPAPGSGLFSLAEYKVNDMLHIVPNHTHHSGRVPYFESVIIHIAKSEQDAVSMLENDTVDVLARYVAKTDTYTPPVRIRTALYTGCKYVFLGLHPDKNLDWITQVISREQIMPENAVSASAPVHPRAGHLLPSCPYEPVEEKGAYTLLFCKTVPKRAQVAAKLAQSLSFAGISVKTKGVSEQEYRARIAKKEYDMFLGETELLPDFAEKQMYQDTVGLYFQNEEILFDESVSELEITTLNPYKSIFCWKPYP